MTRSAVLKNNNTTTINYHVENFKSYIYDQVFNRTFIITLKETHWSKNYTELHTEASMGCLCLYVDSCPDHTLPPRTSFVVYKFRHDIQHSIVTMTFDL